MKIKPDDYAKLKVAIERVLTANPTMAGNYGVAGLSPIRFRWDVLHKSYFNVGALYEYLDDCHIDTALRKIMGEIENA